MNIECACAQRMHATIMLSTMLVYPLHSYIYKINYSQPYELVCERQCLKKTITRTHTHNLYADPPFNSMEIVWRIKVTKLIRDSKALRCIDLSRLFIHPLTRAHIRIHRSVSLSVIRTWFQWPLKFGIPQLGNCQQFDYHFVSSMVAFNCLLLFFFSMSIAG